MKNKKSTSLILSVILKQESDSEKSNAIKQRFLQELQSGDVEDGCKLVIHVTNAAANAACFVPEPTVSKIACFSARILNVAAVNDLDPNMPNLVMDAGVRVCQLTYVSASIGITYTYEFAKNQSKEIKETWNWLNSLQGALQFMEYMSY
jgi:hypothetical protein